MSLPQCKKKGVLLTGQVKKGSFQMSLLENLILANFFYDILGKTQDQMTHDAEMNLVEESTNNKVY